MIGLASSFPIYGICNAALLHKQLFSERSRCALRFPRIIGLQSQLLWGFLNANIVARETTLSDASRSEKASVDSFAKYGNAHREHQSQHRSDQRGHNHYICFKRFSDLCGDGENYYVTALLHRGDLLFVSTALTT